MISSQKSFQFPEVRVVEASAGSGKTFALAKRYVQLLLSAPRSKQHLSISTILAITFMKKASFEMKRRILMFLKGLALQTIPLDQANDILGPIGLDLSQASDRSFELMDELIHHYNFFQVQTIDSFINALLSGCAFKIGLSSKFRIKHNSFDYLAYSLDRLIEHAVYDSRVKDLFTDFLNQYLLLENKGSWFPKKDILGLLNALYHQRNSYGMEFKLPGSRDSIVDQMAAIMEKMRQLHEHLPAATHGTFKNSLDRFIKNYKTAFDFDALSNYFQRECFPMTGGHDAPGLVVDLWDDIRSRLIHLAESEAYLLFSPYIAVFEQMLNEFQAKAAKDDVLFMEELNRKARALFDESGVTVEELYYRLAARFRHYLIDEFQDTSRLQWENLVMMAEEALSTGGSLFYVGDKKQAIYGFRGGDVRLFDQLKQDFARFHVKVDRLTKNYRSHQAVVEFNNMIFSLQNLERFIELREQDEADKAKKKPTGFVLNDEDRTHLASIFDRCFQEYREDRQGGYVRVERIAGERRQDRDEVIKKRIVGIVKELHDRYAWKDIAVLTRKNSELEQVTGWLIENDVPVKSERTLNMTENTVIQEMIALLKFLNSPIDHMSFAQVILGEVFCQAAGIVKEDMHQFLFDRYQRKGKKADSALYREFRQQYPQFWDQYFAPFFRSVGFYPLYELFVSILKEWRVLMNFTDQCGFMMKLLDVIKKREEEGCDLASFLEYVDKLRPEDAFVHVDELDSVQVLTTHKAKGLEFKVVILPFASMEIQVGSRGGAPGEELGQRSYMMNSDGNQMELLRIKSEYLPYSEHLYDIYRAQAVESLLCELNNVYVSFTRAEKEMYVFVPAKSGNSDNLLNFLIPEDLIEMGEIQDGRRKIGKADDIDAPTAVCNLPVSDYRDWITYLNQEFSTQGGELLNRKNIKHGKELHEVLSRVRTIDNGQWIMEKNHGPWSMANGLEQEEILKDLFSREELMFLFQVKGGQVFTEKEIVDKNGQTKRLDRLIVTDDEVIVADYKASRIKDEGLRIKGEGGGKEGVHPYHAQVKDYMNVVAEMYPAKTVKGYLLYLEDLSLEEII